MMNFKLGKIKISSDFMKNNRGIPSETDLSEPNNEPLSIDSIKNDPGKFDTMESLKEDYIRLQNKIKKMDEIIKELKDHLYVNIDWLRKMTKIRIPIQAIIKDNYIWQK